jgi:hypothetical protein
MLKTRQCNVLDEELANGFTIISTCTMQELESKAEAPAGKYEKAFRLMQQEKWTPAEASWLCRFIEGYPHEFMSLCRESEGLTGVPDHLVLVRDSFPYELDRQELAELHASGRIRPRRSHRRR